MLFLGKLIAKRKTGQDCVCSKNCMDNFDEASKQQILEHFNRLGNTNSQNIHLRCQVTPMVARRSGIYGRGGICRADNPPLKKTQTFKYFVVDPNIRRIPVCKEAFKSLHGIGEKRVRTIRNRVS